MAGIQNFVEFIEDFLGPQTLNTSPTYSDRWDITDTSTNGTPTYTVGGINGEATLAFDSTSEVQNVCLFQSDVLNYDIDKLIRVEFGVKQGQATIDSATTIGFGMQSARNDNLDSTAAHAQFRLNGANAIVTQTDDNSTNDLTATSGETLSNAYKHCVIDFAGGTSNVKFYAGGVRLNASTTYDMSGYTAGLQPFVQISKTADTNTDSIVIDYIKIVSRR